MLSPTRRIRVHSVRWRRLCSIIAVAIAAGIFAVRAKAQSFTLFDPNISSSPQTVTSAPLADLLVPNSYIQADGAEFSNFSFSGAGFGGATTPTAADVLITAPTSPSAALEFQGGPFLALSGQFVDASLKFDVTELEPNQKITTAELFYTGGTSGNGTTLITEDVDDMNNNLLGEGNYVISSGSGSNSGKINFAAQTEIQVSKDIEVMGGSSGTGNISDFTQTFDASSTAVPEPSSIAMALMGGAGLGWFGWRRRAKRRAAATAEPHSARLAIRPPIAHGALAARAA